MVGKRHRVINVRARRIDPDLKEEASVKSLEEPERLQTAIRETLAELKSGQVPEHASVENDPLPLANPTETNVYDYRVPVS